ncbi:MAG: hypothetical protein IKO34_12800 [Bacteroidales bacterium]|nr:hypothetical protein [Bacteroidales bacterium]
MPTIDVNGHSIGVNTNIEIRPGYSPYIGTNGHWMVYDISVKAFVDTGVIASKDASFATPFNTTTNYQAGEYVFYNNGLYRFIVDHPAGAWNSNHVTEAILVDNMEDLERFSADLAATMDDVSDIEDIIGNSPMGTDATTLTGAILEHNDKIGNTVMGTLATTLTGAIKELVDDIGDTIMGTVATTLTGAIKEIVDKIGNTSMGTEATTITGAIAEHGNDISALSNKIGTFQCVSMDIGYVSAEPIVDKVQRAFENSAMPKGVPFIADVQSGSRFTMIGYWYPAPSKYGYCYIGNFADFYFVRLDNNVWKITPNVAYTTAASVSIKIGTGATYNGTIARSGKVRIYNFYYSQNSAVGTISLTTPIGTVIDSDKPRYEATTAISMYTAGDYSGTTYNANLMINNSGQLLLRGKISEIAACKEFRGQLVWLVE